MVLRAAQYAEDGRYVSPFRHILVDEFQDISQSRARLVKALKAQLVSNQALREAEILIEQWRRHYNTKRPHSALGYRPPAPETIVPMDPRPVMH